MGGRTTRPAVWTNWARNQTAQPAEVAHPTDAEEVAALVKAAAETGGRVRPIGSGHSFTAIGRPDESATQLVLDRCADLIALDSSSGMVTVQAGMTLRRLNRLLAEAGLALTNLGDIEEQTIAGAISTGTHGTGAAYGGLATQVRALELVLGDGSIVTCSKAERPELFAAARVGLGAIGVITSVTLQTVPMFVLRAEEGPMGLDEVLDRLDAFTAEVDHFEFYWFPHTANTLVKRNTRLPFTGPESLDPQSRIGAWITDELLSNTAFGGVVALGRRIPAAIPSIARLNSRALGSRTFTDLSYRVFTSPRRVRFVEMEYAVPRAALGAVVRELVAAVNASDLRISFPVEVRVAAADDIPLSTASGRESGYIAVHMDYRSDSSRYFELVEKIMVAAGGRPHWGKMHTRDADYLRGQYPRFDEFLAARDAAAPAGVFRNDYLDRVLGRPGGAASA